MLRHKQRVAELLRACVAQARACVFVVNDELMLMTGIDIYAEDTC